MAIRYQIARRMGLAPRLPLIVAPHGECSPGALGIHGARKRVFLRVGAAAGLYRGALFQASTEREESDILSALSWVKPSQVVVAPDVSGTPPDPASNRPPKSPGRVRFVFISRLARMKNLHQALAALGKVSGEVSLDVFGTADDEGYLRECQAAAARLPPNVSLRFHGALAPERVAETFATYDFSLLPTLGENFGHVIFESMVARCPVVLSDRTAWPDLGLAGAGFTVPVDDQDAWSKALQACVDMGEKAHAAMADSARRVALDFVERLGAVRRNVEMFERCLERR
jgi:glycosyltransferase involved in cell wall biosynthesis